jgi:flagellar protein FlaG
MSELEKLSGSVSNQVYTARALPLGQGEVYPKETNKAQVSESESAAPVSSSEDKNAVANQQRYELSPESMEKTLNDLNAQLQDLSSNYLQFERDADTNKMVVYIKNAETNEMIMQIPSEDFLRIAKNIDTYLKQVNESFGSTQNSLPVGLITNQQA